MTTTPAVSIRYVARSSSSRITPPLDESEETAAAAAAGAAEANEALQGGKVVCALGRKPLARQSPHHRPRTTLPCPRAPFLLPLLLLLLLLLLLPPGTCSEKAARRAARRAARAAVMRPSRRARLRSSFRVRPYASVAGRLIKSVDRRIHRVNGRGVRRERIGKANEEKFRHRSNAAFVSSGATTFRYSLGARRGVALHGGDGVGEAAAVGCREAHAQTRARELFRSTTTCSGSADATEKYSLLVAFFPF